LAKVFGFFSLFSAPKFFPLTYLPPTCLTSVCAHFIVKAWESLSRRAKEGARNKRAKSDSQDKTLKTTERELGGKLLPFSSFFFVKP
jgi:hypothetical protein